MTTEPPTTRPPTSTTSPGEPLDAPQIERVTLCLQRENGSGCISLIFHSRVDGAEGYVVETAAGESIPCSTGDSSIVCVAVFPTGAPGCGTTLRAVDAAGRRGMASKEFCVEA